MSFHPFLIKTRQGNEAESPQRALFAAGIGINGNILNGGGFFYHLIYYSSTAVILKYSGEILQVTFVFYVFKQSTNDT